MRGKAKDLNWVSWLAIGGLVFLWLRDKQKIEKTVDRLLPPVKKDIVLPPELSVQTKLESVIAGSEIDKAKAVNLQQQKLDI